MEAADETLGQRIRRLRRQRALSLAQVAGDDFSRAFLNQVESGRSHPSTRVLRVIASRLGTPLDYLLEGPSSSAALSLAVERARLALARGRAAASLRELMPAMDSAEWPMGSDARLTAAEALIALGRGRDAQRLLSAERATIVEHRDPLRLRRLRALERGRGLRPSAGAYVRLAGQAQLAGDLLLALECLRAARLLAEVPKARTRKESRRTSPAPPGEG